MVFLVLFSSGAHLCDYLDAYWGGVLLEYAVYAGDVYFQEQFIVQTPSPPNPQTLQCHLKSSFPGRVQPPRWLQHEILQARNRRGQANPSSERPEKDLQHRAEKAVPR
jgi:hypothetical protein